MNWKQLAEQISKMPPEEQNQTALIFDDNEGRFIELTEFVIDDDEDPPKTYVDQAGVYFDEVTDGRRTDVPH